MRRQPGESVVVMVDLDAITYLTGEVVEDTAEAIVLKRCTWHRNTGRNHEFMAGANSTEREPWPREAHVRISDHARKLCMDWAGNLDAESA